MTDIKTLHIRNPEETNFCSGLYIVPTPIGNLRDITLRALDVLKAADVIVCEDSRVTGKLLKAYAINAKKKIVYNDHADDRTKSYIISLVQEGKIAALVSDAGTPMVSDPGYKLARDCIALGLYVTALPGANAILPALQLSSISTDKFIFAGFLPSKDKAVRNVIEGYCDTIETVIFYDSPNRIEKTVQILGEILPNRKIAIIREISKIYEESIIGKPSDVLQSLHEKQIKGEIVIVIEGSNEDYKESIDIDAMILKSLAEGLSVKELSLNIADKTKIKKKEIYNRALELQKK